MNTVAWGITSSDFIWRTVATVLFLDFAAITFSISLDLATVHKAVTRMSLIEKALAGLAVLLAILGLALCVLLGRIPH